MKTILGRYVICFKHNLAGFLLENKFNFKKLWTVVIVRRSSYTFYFIYPIYTFILPAIKANNNYFSTPKDEFKVLK